MLMDGHNGGITRNGVLAKLGTLQKSDIIEVERGDGRVFRYEVRENQSMDLEEVNTTGMKMMMQSAEVGKEALNLITCDGKWIPRYKQFDRRIMLRAVLVE
jgi:sortase (surface protein transpeptidase)